MDNGAYAYISIQYMFCIYNLLSLSGGMRHSLNIRAELVE